MSRLSLQVLGKGIVPADAAAVHRFLILAALAPQRLGFDPVEASTYRTLPAALKVTTGSVDSG